MRRRTRVGRQIIQRSYPFNLRTLGKGCYGPHPIVNLGSVTAWGSVIWITGPIRRRNVISNISNRFFRFYWLGRQFRVSSGWPQSSRRFAIAHRSHADDPDYARANRIATTSLVQACRRHMIKRLIFMSSIGAQTGSAADHVVTEIDEPRPITAYDRAKLAAEQEIRHSGAPFTILRPVIVYGPGAKANIALIMRIAALPLPLPFGAFENRRSLLAIDNLIQAIILCLDSPLTMNQTFIVSDREPITLAEMFATLREAAGNSPRLIRVPPSAVRAMITATGRQGLWDRIGRELVASSANLQKAGWSPQIETKAGLRAMVRATFGAHRSN